MFRLVWLNCGLSIVDPSFNSYIQISLAKLWAEYSGSKLKSLLENLQQILSLKVFFFLSFREKMQGILFNQKLIFSFQKSFIFPNSANKTFLIKISLCETTQYLGENDFQMRNGLMIYQQNMHSIPCRVLFFNSTSLYFGKFSNLFRSTLVHFPCYIFKSIQVYTIAFSLLIFKSIQVYTGAFSRERILNEVGLFTVLLK